MANNFQPMVEAQDKEVELGRQILVSTMFDYFDLDEDPMRRIRIADLGGDLQGGYFVYNGNRLNANQTYEFTAAQLSGLRYRAGVTTGQELFRIQAYDGRFWSEADSAVIRTIPTNRAPVVRWDATIRGLSSETYSVKNWLNAADRDGDDVIRYRVRIRGNAGRLRLNGHTFRSGQWVTLNQARLDAIEFVAYGYGGPQRKVVLEAYATDGRAWSSMASRNAWFSSNRYRPTVNAKNLELAVGKATAASNMLNYNDADGNSIKRFSFFDTGVQELGGYFSFRGERVAARTWFTIDATELQHLKYHSATIADTEVIRARAYDGRYWSAIGTSTATTYQVPEIDVTETVVLDDLEEVYLTSLFEQTDNGPSIRKYRIFDSNTDNISARLYDGNGNRMVQGQVIELTAAEFREVYLKGGRSDDRSLDGILIRAFNGSEWSDWDRMNVYTEPNYITSLESGLTWNQALGQPRELTYTFLQAVPGYYLEDDPEHEGFTVFTVEQRVGARRGMQAWANVSGLSFRETTQEDGLGHITYGMTTVEDGVAAYAYLPSSIVPAKPGDIWLGENVQTNYNMTPGSYGYLTMLHEQGHAWAFSHPFGPAIPLLPAATDNRRYSVMSYSAAPGMPIEPSTPMLYDIAAIQQIYGANYNYNSGRDVYAWAPNEQVFLTIWDGGGIDTISAKNQTAEQVVDLREGHFSSIGSLSRNVGIAFGARIENGFGGRNNDKLIGNERQNRLDGGEGNDIIRGNGGNDILMGGAGDDMYQWSVGDGNDRIRELGAGGNDILRISVPGNLYTTFRNNPLESSVLFRRQGRNLEIQFDFDGSRGRSTLRLEHQSVASSAVETLRLIADGQMVESDIDLTSVYQNSTGAFRHFTLTNFQSDYGFIAVPV